MPDLIEEIKNQVGSNGEKGWPVAVRDRIHFPDPRELRVTNASVGITFLWTERMSVLPKLTGDNLAIATNFYTPAGIEGMIRNVLGNPLIQNVIMFGEEYSSKSDSAAGGKNTNELTSANAIRAFFERGINTARGIDGFGNSVYVDKNIPAEEIERVRQNLRLHDLNREMRGASLDEKIRKANQLMGTFERGKAWGSPRTFDYEEVKGSFPYEGGPMIVRGRTIPEAWIKMVDAIYRFGVPNLMNAGTDRVVKEINNMTVVVDDPQNEDLTLNPFLVPMTPDKIKAYQAEILSPELPEGKAYTYGNELRAYMVPRPSLDTLVGDAEVFGASRGLKWEFPGVAHDGNINYIGDVREINQIADIIDVLKKDPYSKACVAITWHPVNELMRKHKSSPCLVYLQPLVQGERLNLTTVFRSHDMVQGWPENAYGCARIQREIADAIGVRSGLLTVISGSAQIYDNYNQQVEKMLQTHGPQVRNCTDARGNFLINIRDGKIHADLTHPTTGKTLESYSGETAQELRDDICSRTELQTAHAVYLGGELARAEAALRNGNGYVQG